MIRIYTEMETIFEGTPEQYELFKIKQAFEYAYSYVLPFWRLLFYSGKSNEVYYKRQVEKRLRKYMNNR